MPGFFVPQGILDDYCFDDRDDVHVWNLYGFARGGARSLEVGHNGTHLHESGSSPAKARADFFLHGSQWI